MYWSSHSSVLPFGPHILTSSYSLDSLDNDCNLLLAHTLNVLDLLLLHCPLLANPNHHDHIQLRAFCRPACQLTVAGEKHAGKVMTFTVNSRSLQRVLSAALQWYCASLSVYFPISPQEHFISFLLSNFQHFLPYSYSQLMTLLPTSVKK